MIVIALGSNLADREQNIRVAIGLLAEHLQIIVDKVSSIYETEPVGFKEQPAFLNAVISITTDLQPLELMEICLSVEQVMGRKRELRWGPRNIDIDILLYNDCVFNTEKLQLPHPRMYERRFVLEPLREINSAVLPCGKTSTELLNKLVDNCEVRLFKKINWNGVEQAFG